VLCHRGKEDAVYSIPWIPPISCIFSSVRGRKGDRQQQSFLIHPCAVGGFLGQEDFFVGQDSSLDAHSRIENLAVSMYPP